MKLLKIVTLSIGVFLVTQPLFANEVLYRCSFTTADGPDISIETDGEGSAELYQYILGTEDKVFIDEDERGASEVVDQGAFNSSTVRVTGLNSGTTFYISELGSLPVFCNYLN